jgi:hypothetical protein
VRNAVLVQVEGRCNELRKHLPRLRLGHAAHLAQHREQRLAAEL